MMYVYIIDICIGIDRCIYTLMSTYVSMGTDTYVALYILPIDTDIWISDMN